MLEQILPLPPPTPPTSLNGKNLLCHHREHLQINPVELVEAGPRTTGGETLEKLAQGNVVQSVRAVEHDTLLGHRFGKILDRLRLSCPSGTLRGAPQMQVEGTKQSTIAPTVK